jgi:superfamily II DNA or RNA helicase
VGGAELTGLSGAPREALAHNLLELLAASGGQSKWELFASLEGQGWEGLTTTDVNSVLYETCRSFVHDDGTPPLWWSDECPQQGGLMSDDLAGFIQSLLAGREGRASSQQDVLESELPDASAATGLDLYEGPEPRAWQQEALDAWRAAGRRGVVEAVTGTGKTAIGILAAAEAVAGGGHVLVVVPGRDLLDQWHRKLEQELPTLGVGRLGDGDNDVLEECDVLVATVQSACRDQMMPPGGHGLLIADEVHRYGAERYSQALEPEFTERLGLTATYERDDRGLELHLAPYFKSDTAPAQARGEVVAGCGYERGLADGILSRFRVGLLGVNFTAAEKSDYEKWDAQAKDLMGKLINHHGCPAEPFGEFMRTVTELSEGATTTPA